MTPPPYVAPLARGVTIVTGTDTDVGKTVASAVLVRALMRGGTDVALVKPAQTGLPAGVDGDAQAAARLAGLPADRVHEFSRLPEPLAPTTAARRAGVTLPDVTDIAGRIAGLASRHTAVVVEGAGGVLVGLDNAGGTLIDVADALQRHDLRPRFVVVARAGLGTLNHTALTCDAVRRSGHAVAGVMVGAWPAAPDLAMRCNLEDLPLAAGAPVWALLPAGIGDDAEAVDTAAAALQRA